MAATNYYMAVVNREPAGGDFDDTTSSIVVGNSSSATSLIELRMQVNDSGAAATGLTRKDVLRALETFERQIIQNGRLGDGAYLPVT